MKKITQLIISTVILFSLHACVTPTASDKFSAKNSEQNLSSAEKRLYALFDAEWERGLKNNPLGTSARGDRRYNTLWTDLSLDQHAENIRASQEALRTLNTIDKKQLSQHDQLNYQLFKQQYENNLAEARYNMHLIPLNQRGGIQTLDTVLDRLRFENEQDYVDWLVRLNSFSNYMNQTIALMRKGIATKVMPPKIIMQRIPDQIRTQLVSSPRQSGFYKPYKQRPNYISAERWANLQSQAEMAISKHIIPSYQSFLNFIENEYLPQSRDSFGASEFPPNRIS